MNIQIVIEEVVIGTKVEVIGKSEERPEGLRREAAVTYKMTFYDVSLGFYRPPIRCTDIETAHKLALAVANASQESQESQESIS